MTETTLNGFLLERIAEDEKTAREADVKQGDAAWKVCDVVLSHPRGKRVRSSRDNRPIAYVEDVAGDDETDETDETGILDGEAAADHIARHDPARVLAECKAKREIVRLHATDADCREARNRHGCETLIALVAVFSDHPDFRGEWVG